MVFWLAFYPAVLVAPAVREDRGTGFWSKYWTGMAACALLSLAAWSIRVTVPKDYIAIGVGAVLLACLVVVLYQRRRKRLV